jgi:DNA replication protein DnaC
MAEALEEQRQFNEYEALGFEDRLALLVDREATVRSNHRLSLRLKKAKLRITATIEDVDFRHPRGLDKAVVLSFATCQWIRQHHNCLIIGPTGVGKSYLACALVHKACCEGFRVLNIRTSRIIEELIMPRPMAVTGNCSWPTPGSTCSSSTTGGWRP